MPARIGSRRVPYAGRQYLLEDRFGSVVPAGGVNGTRSTGGQLRTATDTESKISIAGGVLSFATGEVANDAVWYGSMPRAAGRVLLGKLVASEATNGIPAFGWDSAASGAILDCLQLGAAGALNVIVNGAAALALGVYTATTYALAAVMRATGIFWFIKGGAFTNWTFLWATAAGTGAGFPAVAAANTTAVFTADNILIPAQLWLPVPLLSDSFTRADGVLGLTDGAGHAEANGWGGLAWVFDAGVWTIATNKAVGTPTLGAETVSNGEFTSATTGWAGSLATLSQVDSTVDPGAASGGADNGAAKEVATATGADIRQTLTLVAGTWYRVSCRAYAPSANDKVRAARLQPTNLTPSITNQVTVEDTWETLLQTARCTATAVICILQCQAAGASTIGDAAYFDMVTAKPLTLSTLFATRDVGTPDSKVRAKVSALTTGTQAGVVGRLDSASAPTQGVTCYFDGAGNVKLDEFTGTTTWTNKLSGAKAFAANDEIEMDLDGAAYRVYHITSAGVATLIGSGTLASVVTGNIHGMFSTYSGNTFGGCQIWAKGGGRYEVLDTFIGS